MIQLCKDCLQGLATLPVRLMLALAVAGAVIITALTLPHQPAGVRSASQDAAVADRQQSNADAKIEATPIAGSSADKDASRAGPVPSQIASQPSSERSFVIDDPVVRGDSSIRFKDQSVFLSEIERFSSKDVCTHASGERWACGLHAFATLQNSIAKKQIHCIERDVTGNDIEASCEYDGKNLALLLLDPGLARLRGDVQNADLIAAQDAAKAKRVGIWDR